MDIPSILKHPLRCGPFKGSTRGAVRAACLIAVHVAIAAHIAQWKFGGKTLTPVEPSEAATTIELGVVNAGFVLFLVLLASTLVAGRFFCGWACHVVAYQDAAAWLLSKLRLRPLPVRSRLLALVPFYAAAEMFVLPSIRRALSDRPPAAAAASIWGFTTENLWERFPGPWITALTVVVCGGLIVWWLGAKGFCTYACPYGALFGLADRAAPLRIRVTDACEGCGHCTAACTSNVRVHEEVRVHRQVVDAGCMKCLDCVSACPKGALFVGFGAPPFAAPKAAAKQKKAFDFSWGEELAMAALFAASLWTYRGLYHQVPFLLALGLAVLTAFGIVLGVRLAASRDFRFQHATLRSGGSFTGSGRAAVVLGVAALALAGDSAWVQFQSGAGERALRAAQQIREPQRAAERTAARDAALGHLQRAEAAGLFPDAMLQFQLAGIHFDRREAGDAEARLRRALEIDPAMGEARVRLAGLLRARGDAAGADAVMRAGGGSAK